MAVKSTYQDIDLSFKSHPSTKDIIKLYDVDAGKFALKNLLLTNQGENLNDVDFGVGIKSLQFELLTPILSAYVKRKITEQVYRYLPEISLQNLYVGDNPDTGHIDILIEYYVSGNRQPQNYTLVLERYR